MEKRLYGGPAPVLRAAAGGTGVWAWLCVLGCAGLAGSEPAVPAPAPTREVSLTQCLQMALTNNLDVRIERYAPELARYSLNSSYGIYDPLFKLGAKDDFFTSPQRVDPKKPNIDLPYDLDTRAFTPSLSGTLPTGLRYDLGLTTDFQTANTVVSPSFLYPDGIRHVNELITTRTARPPANRRNCNSRNSNRRSWSRWTTP